MLELTIERLSTDELVEGVNKLNNNTYKHLEQGAKRIFGKEILEMFWSCKYETQEEYEGETTQFYEIENNYEIVEDCKDNIKHNFKCMCGKEHLKYCNMIFYR